MVGDPRVRQLLEEILDSGSSPEVVCRECPELLPEVRERLRQLRAVEALFAALFPEPGSTPSPALTLSAIDLPDVPGYDVHAVLGRGGMGVVYEARHLGLNRLVALKMLIAGAYATPAERKRFLREAEAVARLRHPNIVQVYDIGDLDGRPYFTMELVEGGSLSRKLAGTPQPARVAATLLATLAEAVQVAHQAGIVHRDLKPANILLTADGTPKISDFGLALHLEGGAGLTQSGAAIGTPSYMAPEQAQGQARTIGPATDVYALGAILYEVLTGRPPFRAETALETVRQVIAEEPVPPSRLNPKVPRDLETICLKCLHKEPHLRYATAAALADDLKRYLRGEAIAARPEGRLARLARRVRRRPVTSATVALGALLTVVLIGGTLWLVSNRAATAQAAEEDLREMAGWQEKFCWPEANAALQRAKGRLGSGGSADLRHRLDQGARDLELVTRLDVIRLNRVDKVGVTLPFVRADEQADQAYEEQFREAGFGHVHDDPEDVAARVRASNIQTALVAALDDWAVCASDPRRREWVLEVARKADRDLTGWRGRARAPETRTSKAALVEFTKTAPVHDQPFSLLLALAHYLEEAGGDPIPFLTRLQQAHPDDFWTNYTLANKLRERLKLGESIRYYQAALTIRPKTSPVHNNLGLALMWSGRLDEAARYFDRALEIDPTNTAAFGNLGIVWFYQELHDKALERLRQATARPPEFAAFHYYIGQCLERRGSDDEAVVHYRRAVELDPKLPEARREWRGLLIRRGRVEEAQADWARQLEANPPGHDDWYGYAELCLYLGRNDDYRRARQALLAKFGAATDPYIAERSARACLLGPASGEELQQAVLLADRAANVERSKYPKAYAHFAFVRGLAEYRQGQFDRAIATMRGDAASVLGPAPRLVLAMALQRSGQVAEARKTLAAAVVSHDWRAGQVRNQDDWIFHVLRREAEAMILPDLPAFLAGKQKPRDADERQCFLAACQFGDRPLTVAKLYSEIFASDPSVAADFRAGHRATAACSAAWAGCGRGTDTQSLDNSERAGWRSQARAWLRADLLAWNEALLANPAATRDALRERLPRWRADPDLAGLREPIELEKLPADEKADCLALWAEVDKVLGRAEGVARKP